MKTTVLITVLTATIAGIATIGLTTRNADDAEKKKPATEATNQINPGVPFLAKPISFGQMYPVNPASFFNVRGKYTRPVTKEKLNQASSLNDIIPYYPENWIGAYKWVEIQTNIDGKVIKANGQNNLLTEEQKKILCDADLGSDINFTVKYQSKTGTPGNNKDDQMNVIMTIVPEKEAEFYGGRNQMIKYFTEHGSKKLFGRSADLFQQASILFTVSEEGKIDNVELNQTTGYPEVDVLLVELVGNMPDWKPAETDNGKKVKQIFEFTFGGEAGC